jgi:hypothetical protein
VRSDDQAKRSPHATDLLDRDGIGERIEARSALVLGKRNAKPAHLAETPDDIDRKAPRPLVLVDDGRHLVGHEVADRVAEENVLRGEVEVHDPEPITTLRRRVSAPPEPVLAFADASAGTRRRPR